VWKKTTKKENNRPKRIAEMSNSELKSWLNASLMELGMMYDQWQYHDGPSSEVDKILKIVTDLWEELSERQ
jgi:hypothetical protein